jgi:hypothetical protein
MNKFNEIDGEDVKRVLKHDAAIGGRKINKAWLDEYCVLERHVGRESLTLTRAWKWVLVGMWLAMVLGLAARTALNNRANGAALDRMETKMEVIDRGLTRMETDLEAENTRGRVNHGWTRMDTDLDAEKPGGVGGGEAGR